MFWWFFLCFFDRIFLLFQVLRVWDMRQMREPKASVRMDGKEWKGQTSIRWYWTDVLLNGKCQWIFQEESTACQYRNPSRWPSLWTIAAWASTPSSRGNSLAYPEPNETAISGWCPVGNDNFMFFFIKIKKKLFQRIFLYLKKNFQKKKKIKIFYFIKKIFTFSNIFFMVVAGGFFVETSVPHLCARLYSVFFTRENKWKKFLQVFSLKAMALKHKCHRGFSRQKVSWHGSFACLPLPAAQIPATNIISTWMLLYTNFSPPPPAFLVFFRETHKNFSPVHSHATFNTKLHQYSRYFCICCGWDAWAGGGLFSSHWVPILSDRWWVLRLIPFPPPILLDNPPDSCEGGRSASEKSLATAMNQDCWWNFSLSKWCSQNALDPQPFYGFHHRSLPFQRYFPDCFVDFSLWCTHSIQG